MAGFNGPRVFTPNSEGIYLFTPALITASTTVVWTPIASVATVDTTASCPASAALSESVDE